MGLEPTRLSNLELHLDQSGTIVATNPVYLFSYPFIVQRRLGDSNSHLLFRVLYPIKLSPQSLF